MISIHRWAAVALAAALWGCSTREGDGRMAGVESTAVETSPMDKAKPARIETATFALG